MPILVAVVLACSAQASACPPILQRLHTSHVKGADLCEVHDRYQNILRRLEEKGFRPATRVGNVMGPRFINLPDWLAKRDRTDTAAWTAYEPAPVTWSNWEKSARIVDLDAQKNFAAGQVQTITFDWLAKIQGAAINELADDPGQLRTSAELGLAIKRSTALTPAQIQGVREIAFPSLIYPGKGLTGFSPTICLEDQSEIFQKNYAFSYARRSGFDVEAWPPVDPNTYFTAEDGQLKQCGIIEYAPSLEVEPQLRAWFRYVNHSIQSWNKQNHGTPADPVLVASRAQRWLIAIHPYSAGNGRTSRFVMDWIFESLGLPAPILPNMNYDIYSTQDEWADEVGEGLLRAIRAGEACLLRPNIRGCKVVASETPVGITANAN